MSQTYHMRAKDSVTAAIYTWSLDELDFSGTGYPGPNTATHIMCTASTGSGGDVTGPEGGTSAGMLAAFADTTGKLLQSVGYTIATLLGLAGDYGSGIDGALVVATGTTVTPTREMYYSSIEIQGTGKLDCYHAIYCSGTVDISGVTGTGGIIADGANGTAGGNSDNSGAATTGGTGGAARADGTVGGSQQGGNGANGSSGGFDVGQTGNNGSTISRGFGGNGGGGAKGGSGTGVPTAVIGSAGVATAGLVLQAILSAFNTTFFGQLGSLSINRGGAGGAGGNSGSGCGGANLGGAGGAGGGGGGGAGVLLGRWRKLKTSITTPAGAIRARGGAGGNGGNCDALVELGGSNQTGGGGSGAGGGGGSVNLDIGEREGPAITDLVIADGGASGAGGSGFIGATPAAGPAGGARAAGGQSGQIYVCVRSTGARLSAARGTAGATTLAGTLGVGAPSGAGGVSRVTL
jgi:hypothetical protein